MHKLSKAEVMREVKDYIYITLGLISYSLGWAAFLLPYQITTGGTTGIGAIIYYATGFPIQWSYFIINAVLMTFAIRVLGPRFSIKTTYAIFTLTFLLWLFQLVVNNYVEAPDMTPDGKPLLLGTCSCIFPNTEYSSSGRSNPYFARTQLSDTHDMER